MEILEEKLTQDELYSLAQILYSNYDTFMQDVNVWNNIKKFTPQNVYKYIEPFKTNLTGHEIVNNLVMKYYPCEQTLKYNLASKYLNRNNEITAFEINVGESRLDIGRINGHSYAYEIKTELDSLDKLNKQINDYAKVFEYIYVIIHPKHLAKVKQLVPDFCGIITYSFTDFECKFGFRKKAHKSPLIDKELQLLNLNTKELEWMIRKMKLGSVPNNRINRHILISENIKPPKINSYFKKTLKMRYYKQWAFICKNFSLIKPIDVQSFFKSKANPHWIYYKNSSRV
ncbi:sce7726 family protein [Salicibibacter halophilus]|nr:sce7726 family protein [Salicibibacter halophilus]